MKTDAATLELERVKLSQDMYIDKLNEQIKEMEDKSLLFDAQLNAQKKETETATQILKEAQGEMEVNCPIVNKS
jgi:hypothetical protein